MKQDVFKVEHIIRNRYIKNFLQGFDSEGFPRATWDINKAQKYESEDDAADTLEYLGNAYELITL